MNKKPSPDATQLELPFDWENISTSSDNSLSPQEEHEECIQNTQEAISQVVASPIPTVTVLSDVEKYSLLVKQIQTIRDEKDHFKKETKQLLICKFKNLSMTNYFFSKYLHALLFRLSSSGAYTFTEENLKQMSDSIINGNFFNIANMYGRSLKSRRKFFRNEFHRLFVKNNGIIKLQTSLKQKS